MSRLDKLAIFFIIACFIAYSIIAAVFLVNENLEAVSTAALLLLALPLGRRWLKKKEKMEWDEREREIGNKANIVAFTFLWITCVVAFVGFAMAERRELVIPAEYVFIGFLAAVYILYITASLAMLFFSRAKPLKAYTFLPLLLVLMAPLIIAGVILVMRAIDPVAPYGGNEAQEWHVKDKETIEVVSHLNLTRWPNRNKIMQIRLPYEEAKLVKAEFTGMALLHAFGMVQPEYVVDREIPVKTLPDERYELHMPQKLRSQLHPTTVRIHWSLPISALEIVTLPEKKEYYQVSLQGLIPVRHFSLKVILEPDCGFELADGSDGREAYCVTLGHRKYQDDILGSCGLGIQPKTEEQAVGMIEEPESAGGQP
ncbi:MAG: hypothetical protein JXA52_00015 [Planctomycetes bacterium]|nr:hypothetical protein [Planctomycetota bacterium]